MKYAFDATPLHVRSLNLLHVVVLPISRDSGLCRSVNVAFLEVGIQEFVLERCTESLLVVDVLVFALLATEDELLGSVVPLVAEDNSCHMLLQRFATLIAHRKAGQSMQDPCNFVFEVQIEALDFIWNTFIDKLQDIRVAMFAESQSAYERILEALSQAQKLQKQMMIFVPIEVVICEKGRR